VKQRASSFRIPSPTGGSSSSGYGFMVAGNAPPNTFGISNLESPADDVLHIVVAIWALAVAFLPRRSMQTATS